MLPLYHEEMGLITMSRRTDKKRLKKINQTQAAAPAAASAAASAAVPVPEAVPAEVSAPAAAAEAAPQAAPAQAEPAPSASAGYEMFLQYQNYEFDIDDIAKSILEKCSAEHMDSADLKIYVKPEDKKAYYVCAGGNSFIDL